MFLFTKKTSKKINLVFALNFLILFLSTGELFAQPGNGPGGNRRNIRTNGRNGNHTPRPKIDTLQCRSFDFRTIDGTCNNLSRGQRMEWGATDIEFERAVTPAYGSSDRFNALGGENRPSAREVSNNVIDQPAIIFSQFNLSALVYNWGQFLDHDISLTPENEEAVEDIPLPADEPLFTEEITFHRSEYVNEPMDGEPREQLNILTAWVDASQVYGSTSEREEWLRSGVDGKMKVSEGNLLPFNTMDGEYDSDIDTLAPSTAGADLEGKMWIAGDLRVGEQVGLTSLHTIFVREHNRICDELIADGMTDDDEIFETAREKVAALCQKITYKDFLPALGVELPDYTGYDNDINPNVTNVFATAAYRMGHTMVVDSVRQFDNDCNVTADTVLSLIDAFFNPGVVREHGIEPFLKGISVEVQYEVDPYIVDELRDFLFTDAENPTQAGLDLAALNIQRGRDHGLPDFNTIREAFVGSKYTSFDEISTSPVVVRSLENTYDSVDDIDAWVGMLCETRVSGTSLGITLHEIMKDQLGRLRDGDRYYYEGYMDAAEVEEINNTTLGDIIERNTPLTSMQDNVFYSLDCAGVNSTKDVKQLEGLITVSPNPSSGIINIKYPESEFKVTSVYLSDISGKGLLRINENPTELNLSDYPNGTYFMNFKIGKDRFITKKIVLVK